MTRRLLAAILLAALLAALSFPPAPALAEKTLPFPKELFSEAETVSGGLRAKVSMKKVRRSRVLSSIALQAAPAEESADSSAKTPQDDADAAVFDIGPVGGAPVNIHDFNRLGVDSLDLEPDNPGLVHFSLDLAGANGETARFVSDPLASVTELTLEQINTAPDAVEVAGAEWKEKNWLYLARRVLNLPGDAVWRWTQSGESAFVQRRFERELIDVGAVDVLLRRNQRVQVNLVVGLDPDNPRSRTVIDWYKLPKRVFPLDHGRSVLRLYVGRRLREAFPGAKSVVLKELSFMFFREKADQVLESRNVERIVFVPSGLDPRAVAEHGLPRRLPTACREIFSGRRRLTAGLAVLSKPRFRDMVLRRARLVSRPMETDRPYGARFEGLRLDLVSPRRDTPAFLAATDAMCETFLGDCDIGRGEAADQDVLAHLFLPFTEKMRGKANRRARLFGTERLFRAQGPVHASRSRSGLLLEGRSPFLEIPLAASPAAAAAGAARRSLWLELGETGPGLRGVFFTARGPDGRIIRIPVKPGDATPLADLPKILRRPALRFEFSATGRTTPAFSLTLRRIVLSAVVPGERKSVFAARMLMPQNARLPAPPQAPPQAPWQWLTLADKEKKTCVAAFLPGIDAAGGGFEAVKKALPPGEIEDIALTGAALSTWPEEFAKAPAAIVKGAALTPQGLDRTSAERMAKEDAWVDLGRTETSGDGVAFADNPWFETESLLFDADVSLSPQALARQGGAAAPHKSASTLLKAGLGLLALVLALVLGRRLPWNRILAPAARFLSGTDRPETAGRRSAAWVGAALAAVAAGALFGGGAGWWGVTLAGLCLVPVWRDLSVPAAKLLEPRFPKTASALARSPARRYFAGFAAALAVAALLRAVHPLYLAPLSEFIVRVGVHLLLVGLFLEAMDAGAATSNTDEGETAS